MPVLDEQSGSTDTSLPGVEHAIDVVAGEVPVDVDGTSSEASAFRGRIIATVQSTINTMDSFSTDRDAVDRFVNEGGPPAAIPENSMSR
jgi:hypothetical protein